MTSPNLASTLRQPASRPRLDRPDAAGNVPNPLGAASIQAGAGRRARPRVRGWNPRLSESPAGALEARLTRAFRLLGPRSAPLVSMLYAPARPGTRAGAAGLGQGRGR